MPVVFGGTIFPGGVAMRVRIIGQYYGLPHQIYLLFIARTITAMGAFVFPFLTMFLSSRLHYDETQIASYLLLMAFATILGAPLGGKLADRFSRKRTYITVMLLSDTCYLLAGFFCESLGVVYLIWGGSFFMQMGMPILSAMMMDLTTPMNRQESFSLVYLGFNLGYAFGPLIAGLLFEDHTRWIFWGQALLNLTAVSLIAFLVHDTRPDRAAAAEIAADASRHRERAENASLLRLLIRNPLVLFAAASASLYALSYSQLSYILPLQMEELFGIASGSKYFGAIWSLNGAMVFIATPVLVLISKHRPPLFNLAMAGIFYCLGFGLYSWCKSLLPMYLLVVVWSCGEVTAATNTGVLIANYAPISHRARYQSIYDMIQGAGRAFGPLLMSPFLARFSYTTSWRLISLLCLTGASLFFLLLRWESRRQGRPLRRAV